MSTPLITWGCIVSLFIIILVARLCHAMKFFAKNKHQLISFITEREEFFVPGDPNPRNDDGKDLDFFDDL